MHILFVCTGNICRSPMAEGMFRHLLKDRPEIVVASAGVSASAGYPPSAHAIEVLRLWGIDISRQRSQPLTESLVRRADYIFGMTQGHVDALLMLYPEAADKVFLCRQFLEDRDEDDLDISDPIGQGINAYYACRDSLKSCLASLLEYIDQDEPNIMETPSSTAQGTTPGQKTTRIALGADHGGVALKSSLKKYLSDKGYAVSDFGTNSEVSVDYPDFAGAVCQNITARQSEFGILICKTGIGMSISANRYPQIRAALIGDSATARVTREHNDSNVLCLPGTLVESEARRIVDTFLSTSFAGGRHQARLDKAQKLGQPAISRQNLQQVDPEIFACVQAEERRQFENIELIASENFTSQAVMEAQGSCLTNKYAEGYPGRRWYGGCEHVDVVEQLAIDRAKELFGAEYVNVQPHSGSQANMAVYFSVLDVGDKILTMDLSHGGHLTHGNAANFSGRFFEVTHYGVSQEDERIDYDGLARQAETVRPRMITAGASAYPRIIDFERMKQIADSVDAYLFVDMAHIAGLVAAGVHPSPVGLADFVTSTTHKSLRGPRGGIIFCREEFGKKIDSNTFPGIQGGPLMHVIAGKAVCFHEALQPAFKDYQKQIALNARALAARLTQKGFRLVSGGTDNHLMLIDLRPQGLNGKVAQHTLDEAGITVNKNGIPFDTEKITLGGGIRIGTPAVTTRGMKEEEMMEIADYIHEALQAVGDEAKLHALRDNVHALTARFPLP